MQCLHRPFKYLDWSYHPLKVPSSVPRDLATSFTSCCLAWCEKKTFSMYLSNRMQYSFIYHGFFLFRGSIKIWLLLCKKIWNWGCSLRQEFASWWPDLYPSAVLGRLSVHTETSHSMLTLFMASSFWKYVNGDWNQHVEAGQCT